MERSFKAILCLFLAFCAGCVKMAALVEPQRSSLASLCDKASDNSYELPLKERTLGIPVAFEVPGADAMFIVRSENIIGDTITTGQFKGGRIIEREFRKVFESGFRLARADETPVAKVIVRILGISVSRLYLANTAKATLRIQVEVRKPASSQIAFSEVFTATSDKASPSNDEVPAAFYFALDAVIRDFLSAWNDGNAVSTVIRWRTDAAPELKPPELASIDWNKNNDVWHGHCTVKCNGYEPFEARAWASEHISAMCRNQLGNIDRRLVRIVYDDMRLDSEARIWSFSFSTFPRQRIVFYFDRNTKHGYVVGDLELMDLSADIGKAKEELKNLVLKEMKSFAGAVSLEVQTAEALVRFDKSETDSAFGLLTYYFRLVY